MYRKIIIIFISVFLKTFGHITQALIIFILLIVFILLNIKLRPFAIVQLNDMENLSLVTSIVSIYCGIFYLSDQGSQGNSEEEEDLVLSTGSKNILFLIIVLSNLLFFLYWSSKMFTELKNTIRIKFSSFYLYLCLCGNKERLQEETEKRRIKDENEVLREEFIRSNTYYLLLTNQV